MLAKGVEGSNWPVGRGFDVDCRGLWLAGAADAGGVVVTAAAATVGGAITRSVTNGWWNGGVGGARRMGVRRWRGVITARVVVGRGSGSA